MVSSNRGILHTVKSFSDDLACVGDQDKCFRFVFFDEVAEFYSLRTIQCGKDDVLVFSGKCALKEQLIKEFNDLHVPGMDRVTDLNALPGSYINLEYTLESGQKIKFWEDGRVYLGNQLCKHDGSGRCFGLTADENWLLVCEYGDNGSDPEIVVYKRREK